MAFQACTGYRARHWVYEGGTKRALFLFLGSLLWGLHVAVVMPLMSADTRPPQRGVEPSMDLVMRELRASGTGCGG